MTPHRAPVFRVAAVTAEISRTLESAAGADERIRRALTLTRSLVPFDRCGVLYAEVEGDAAVIEVSAGGRSTALARRLQQLWAVLQCGGACDVSPSASPRIALPLVRENDIIGLLLVERDGDEAYRVEHVRLLSTVACQLASYLSLVRPARLVDADDRELVADGARGAQSPVPLECPQCGARAGLPYRARTKIGTARMIVVSSRCGDCGHDWQQDLYTASSDARMAAF